MDRADEMLAQLHQHKREMAELDASYEAMDQAEYEQSMAELDAREAERAARLQA